MRKLVYIVVDNSGNEFHTSNYSKATAKGNKIIGNYLVSYDGLTAEERAKKAEKNRAIIAKRKAYKEKKRGA